MTQLRVVLSFLLRRIYRSTWERKELALCRDPHTCSTVKVRLQIDFTNSQTAETGLAIDKMPPSTKWDFSGGFIFFGAGYATKFSSGVLYTEKKCMSLEFAGVTIRNYKLLIRSKSV